ncbi:drug/metabolite transporter (DMT)-like permease [Pararhizobium capsulatum DSM 1112]|uniref:Drug/metabolite transporter (DMT)-like permease n=1 Tax=Pararhizobium capsulatum DSM 1112 TaxID=1121113 RepID=A0ABU0BZT0_9HYPH|nr:DMT family transporter [Pararhizobium capsulatum]MDQ0323181.1 drug/metabolite transporter (DMT)-like permease [Pararhizobium capsulatum DSM 1112]
MVVVATLAWSFAGLLTRMLSVDVWTAVCWRAFAGGAMLLVPVLVRERSNVLRSVLTLGSVGWITVGLSVVAQASTTAGLFLTSVAHVTVIYATCPFLAAILAWLWLGETISRSALVAVVLSIVGIAIVVSGATETSSLLGDSVAFVMTLSFALIIVMSKANPTLRLLEITLVSTFLIFLPFARTETLDLHNGVVLAIYGFNNMVLGFFLFIRGARNIPAATSGLIATLEIVLSPLWVWLFFNETIDALTFIGGIIVVIAVLGHLIASIGWERSARAPA